CGGMLDCGTCAGGGFCCTISFHHCVASPSDCCDCCPKTCAQQGIQCGPAGDGCGNLLDCGTCPPPLICGGGMPGVCLCPPSAVICGGKCTDTKTDPQNCGACGQACAPGTVCVAGTCGCGCSPPQVCCNAVCTALATDPFNCGACGHACTAGS